MRGWAGGLLTAFAVGALLGACHTRKAPPAASDTLARLSQTTGDRVATRHPNRRGGRRRPRGGRGCRPLDRVRRGTVHASGDKVNVPADSVRQVVQAQLPNEDLGPNLAAEAPSYEWVSGESRWRGAELATGGGRYLLSRGPSFRPYIGGGPGVLNLQRTITERTLGDVSDPVLAVFGAPDGFINPREESSFRAMAEFIAGVGIASGRTYVDVGYRFRKVFHVESFTFSQFTVGVGMRF